MLVDRRRQTRDHLRLAHAEQVPDARDRVGPVIREVLEPHRQHAWVGRRPVGQPWHRLERISQRVLHLSNHGAAPRRAKWARRSAVARGTCRAASPQAA
eukprot:4418003-Prymnesium_polylepis.1